MRKKDFFAGMATMMLIILMVSTASAKSGKVTRRYSIIISVLF